MRGKKGSSAANRHRFAELEQRAEKAERRAEKAEAEILDLRGRLDRETTGLRRELSDVRKQRDEAAAPAVVFLEQQLADVRRERDEALEKADAQKKRHEAILNAFQRTLTKIGFSATEALEIVMATSTDIRDDFRLVDDRNGISKHALKRFGRNNADAIDHLQRAKGIRKNEGLKAELIAAVNADDETDEDAE